MSSPLLPYSNRGYLSSVDRKYIGKGVRFQQNGAAFLYKKAVKPARAKQLTQLPCLVA